MSLYLIRDFTISIFKSFKLYFQYGIRLQRAYDSMSDTLYITQVSFILLSLVFNLEITVYRVEKLVIQMFWLKKLHTLKLLWILTHPHLLVSISSPSLYLKRYYSFLGSVWKQVKLVFKAILYSKSSFCFDLFVVGCF